MTGPAPIVVFTYNRPFHTRQTLESLKKNLLARESQLFIYSDAPKNRQLYKYVNEVRNYIHSLDGFRKINIIERDKNRGLADSIVDGVTAIINQYGKIIVLEDDIVTTPYFLKFMNDALDFYKNEQKVWHISGWNYPINPAGLPDTFLWRTMNCWGWATWADRWQYYEKNINKITEEFSSDDVNRFNLDGAENFWQQVVDNQKGKINTWAIFWYAAIFKHRGLCLNPSVSMVQNIGHDCSGSHCGTSDIFNGPLADGPVTFFEQNITESRVAVEKIKRFYRKNTKTFAFRLSEWIRKAAGFLDPENIVRK